MNTPTPAAVIAASSGKSVEFRELPGIFSCLMQHKVTETKADFQYTGPKISPVAWQEMLAFFRWANDTERSEAQARLFVHAQHGWKIWAFPQDGGTGMTTREVANEDSKKQRSEIGEGYEAFGTGHSHCNAPAFQSGVDAHDETSVDGLHITIGKLNEAELYDLHARVYVKGHKFDVNLAAFWDIGEESRKLVDAVSALGFDAANIADRIARRQMCAPPPKDHPFNQQWQVNYLLHKPKVAPFGPDLKWCNICMGYHSESGVCPKKSSGGTNGASRNSPSIWSPADVLDELEVAALGYNISADEFDTWFSEFADGQVGELNQKVIDLCSDNFIKLPELFVAWEKRSKERDEKEEALVAQEEAELHGITGKLWSEMTLEEQAAYEKTMIDKYQGLTGMD